MTERVKFTTREKEKVRNTQQLSPRADKRERQVKRRFETPYGRPRGVSRPPK